MVHLQPRLTFTISLSLGAGLLACGPSVAVDDPETDAQGSAGTEDWSPTSVTPSGGTVDDWETTFGSVSTGGDESSHTTAAPTTPDASPTIGSGEQFVDAFVGELGIYVVHAWGVDLLARDGSLLAEFVSDRVIESAAFGGERLAVADQAILNVLDPDLQSVASAPLVEGCAASVLVSGRFICGPDNDWDRIFYTYDVQDGTMLSMSEPYTYKGIPMRRVPGLDEFVTVNVGSSPSDFFLHAMAGDTSVFINDSPYHGDFAAVMAHAFWGDPATHLINAEGIMLRIHGEDCVPGSTFESECFTQDGELGTLPLDLRQYADLREGRQDVVYAVAPDNENSFPFGPVCGEPSCTIQKIDVPTRTVQGTVSYVSSRGGVQIFPDPFAERVFVVGFDLDFDEGEAYTVSVFEL